MIDLLRAWLTEGQGEGSDDRDGLKLAIAALLMEAAQIDGALDDRERGMVQRLLARRFALSPAQVNGLAATAERQAERSSQIFGFTRLINDRASWARRIELVEMPWEVAYADGVLDPLEDVLLRRSGGLVDVSDQERGAAAGCGDSASPRAAGRQ